MSPPIEAAHLAENDLLPLREQLRDIVRQEFEPTRAIPRIEKANMIAAEAQRILDLMIADRSFPPFAKSDEDGFWPAVNDWDQILEQHDHLIVPKMDAELLRRIKDQLLLEIAPPQAGNEADPRLPAIQVTAAIDTACRIADGFKVKKSEITIDQIKRVILKELDTAVKRHKKLQAG